VFVTLYDLNARLHLQITAGNRDFLIIKLPGADRQDIAIIVLEILPHLQSKDNVDSCLHD
jgi:hypothetical protein